MENFNIQAGFPTIITSNSLFDQECFFEKIKEIKDELFQIILKHGALLFRGFPIYSAKHFSRLITELQWGQFVNYIGGDSPRDKIEEGIYTSTEAPPTIHIPLHQELSFMKHFPKHIYFYCEVAPLKNGETIIADARKVYHSFSSEFRNKFEKKGLTYISRYYYRSRIMQWINKWQRSHKSWLEVFECDDKKAVEKQCQNSNFQWQWLARDWLEIKQTCSALLSHPITNESVWFNQAHLYDFNPRLLGLSRYLGAKLFYNNKTRLHDIEFADGDKIPRKDLYHVLDVLDKNTVAFPWHRGDVLILDNVLAMHGRATFQGKRRVLTALTD